MIFLEKKLKLVNEVPLNRNYAKRFFFGKKRKKKHVVGERMNPQLYLMLKL